MFQGALQAQNACSAAAIHMQEKQYGHSAVTSAGTPPLICWEVHTASTIPLYEGKMQALTGCMNDYTRFHTDMH